MSHSRSLHKLALIVVAAALLLALAGQTVAGQTTSPAGTGTPTAQPTPVTTPTAVATSTPPSGKDLLAAANTAIAAKNTYHLVSDQQVVIPKNQRTVSHSVGDLSLKPVMEHSVGTTRQTNLKKSPQTTTVTHEKVIAVGNTLAVQSNKKAWQCVNLTTATNAVQGLVNGLLGSVKLLSTDNLGQETVNNLPVWHVRVVMSVSPSGKAQRLTAGYYISQADNTLVRETASGTLTIMKTKYQQTLSSNYSQYGEVWSVKLPSACAQTQATSAPPTAYLQAVLDAVPHLLALGPRTAGGLMLHLPR